MAKSAIIYKPTNHERPAVVIDLDGTLLHAEAASIAVPGASGFRYMSRRAAVLLTRISRHLPGIVGTGRNAKSAAGLIDQLTGVSFSGFVLENGMVVRRQLQSPCKKNDHWAALAERLPGWQRLQNYENCIGFFITIFWNSNGIMKWTR